MSPLKRFNFMIEPRQLAVLKAVEQHIGVTVGEQIRRAVREYIRGLGGNVRAERVRRELKALSEKAASRRASTRRKA